jgi:hypothetical protein
MTSEHYIWVPGVVVEHMFDFTYEFHGKLNSVNLADVLYFSQFSLISQAVSKMVLTSKEVKKDSKIIILVRYSNSGIHTV